MTARTKRAGKRQTARFRSERLALTLPGGVSFVCRRVRDRYWLHLQAETGSGPVLVAREAYEGFRVYVSREEFAEVAIYSAKAGRDKRLQLWGRTKDERAGRWRIRVEVSPRAMEGVDHFVEKIRFKYVGLKECRILGFSARMSLSPRGELIHYIPGFSQYNHGEEHPYHAERNAYLREAKRGWNVRTILCATPLVHLYWPQERLSYAVATMSYFNGIMPGLELKCVPGSMNYIGVSYPDMDIDAFPGNSPGLTATTGDEFSWEIFHFVDPNTGPHRHGDYAKVWYYLKGDHGDYNRWTGTGLTLELVRDGYLMHHDSRLAILYDSINYDGTCPHAHRGMTNGWTSGASAAYHMMKLGVHLGDDDLFRKSVAVLDNISGALTPSGFYYSEFDEVGKRWSPGLTWWRTAIQDGIDKYMPQLPGIPDGKVAGVPISETAYYMLKSYLLLKARGIEKEPYLESAISNLKALGRVAPEGVFGMYHDPVTGEIVKTETPFNHYDSFSMDWVAALSLGYRITADKSYLTLARKAADYYSTRFLGRIILPGDPPDNCPAPMSESAYHALRGFWELYATTKERTWLDCAIAAGHIVLGWRMAWNARLPTGSELSERGFKTIGFDEVPISHHYGCMTVSYLLELWKATGEKYWLARAVDTVQSAPQFLSRFDGDLEGRRGMLTEQLDYLRGKMLHISHVAPLGWVTHAILCCRQEFGGVLVDLERGSAGCVEIIDLEEVEKTKNGVRLTLHNPWHEAVSTSLGMYFTPADISVSVDGSVVPTITRDGDRLIAGIRLKPRERHVLDVRKLARG